MKGDKMSNEDPTHWQEKLGLEKSEYDPNARSRPSPLQGPDSNRGGKPSGPYQKAAESTSAEPAKSGGKFAGIKSVMIDGLKQKGAMRVIIALVWGFLGTFLLTIFGMSAGYAFLISGGYMFLRYTQPVQKYRPLRIALNVSAVIALILAFLISYATRALYQ